MHHVSDIHGIDCDDAGQVLRQAIQIGQLASELLVNSGYMLERALRVGRVGTDLGAQLTKAIAVVKAQIGENSLESLDTPTVNTLTAAAAAARVTAREAASAALAVRSMVGGAASPAQRYFWVGRSATTTMADVEDRLRLLAGHVSRARQARPEYGEELATIEASISSMRHVADQNVLVASETAAAMEWLHVQAITFVRATERAGLVS